jgi:hypothetical protein
MVVLSQLVANSTAAGGQRPAISGSIRPAIDAPAAVFATRDPYSRAENK